MNAVGNDTNSEMGVEYLKKILLLIPSLGAGGAEHVMVTLANEWSKENDVTFMVFDDGTSFYYLEPKVCVNGMNLMPRKGKLVRKLSIPIIEYKRFRYIYKEIKNGKYDFILSFCWTMNVFASLVSILQKDKTLIVSERSDPTKYSKLLQILICYLYKKNLAVVCQTGIVKEYFLKRNFHNNMLILPNPVNYTDIPTERCINFKKEIVSVGRLDEAKNHKLLIEAFNEISQKYPEYSLKIYGMGKLEKELRNQIDNLGLGNKVKLMGTKKKVMYEVNSSAIFVLASNHEGFPNALIEAMAVGMPVISSRFATIADDLIIEGENGYLFEVGNKNSLVDALEKMLDREDEFLDFAEKNRKVAEQFRDSDVAERWLEEIDKL